MSKNKLILFLIHWSKKNNTIKNIKLFDEQLKEITEIKEGSTVAIFKKSLINEIKTLSPKDIKILCSNNYIRKIFYKFVKNNEISLSTVKTYCSEINKEISNKLNDKDFKKLRDNNLQITIKYKDTVKINNNSKKKVENKNNNILLIDGYKILKLVEILKDSNNWIDKVILFGLCSGCRFIEILNKNVSIFKESKDNNKIFQIGTAKEKKHVEFGHNKHVLFLTKEEVLNLNTDIRNNLNELDLKKNNKQLTGKYSKRVNTRLKELLKQINLSIDPKEYKFHLLRKIYANYCFEVFGRFTTLSYPAYIKKCLCHDSIGALLSYSSLRIIYPKNTENKNKENTENKEVDIKEKYKNIKKRGMNSQRKILLQELIKELRLKNMKVTYKTLRSYGYGSRIISSVLKK